MKIAIGADSYGFDLKEAIKSFLLEKGHEVQDLGISSSDGDTPYYQIAADVAKQVATHEAERAILFCGTGMGMAIIANKFPGVYAAPCENTHAARNSRSINNANVLTMGGMFTAPALAQEIVGTWLDTEFTQGWGADTQAWLENSMKDINQIESSQFSDD
ncbi:RpiB/LacA/LacB family sugar-phosphate isomerase [Haliangium sp.]|uniref:RpiB/LacA/LacB family sugar-phosphate isomerase n=1 Tax=Haliangium sp. TaxID=2663208 RepID=UPI003D099025